MIISTVRSSTDFITADITRMLGFVASPHRFNGKLYIHYITIASLQWYSTLLYTVAVTRAQALLIVVGNPIVLSLDPLWRAFLNYVHCGGGWRGKAIPWDPAGPVNPVGGERHGYDTEMRRQAAAEAEDTLARLKALITRKNEEIEDGFQFELDDSDDGFGLGEGAVFREDD